MPSPPPTAMPTSVSRPSSPRWTTARRPPASATAFSPADPPHRPGQLVSGRMAGAFTGGGRGRLALDNLGSSVPSGLESAPSEGTAVSDTDIGPEDPAAPAAPAAAVATPEPR